MRTLSIIAIALMAFSIPSLTSGVYAESKKACPESRAFLEPRLKTRPADGEYYAVQREAIKIPIAEILRRMGGPRRAEAIARATRAHARNKIEAGAEGSAKRHWQDTILRADALLSILNCLGHLGEPA